MYHYYLKILCTFLLCCLGSQVGMSSDSRDARITVTGEARIPVTINPVRAEHLAHDMAERDAKKQILISAYGKPIPQGARLVGELRNVIFSAHERFEKEGRPMVRVDAHVNRTDIGPIRLVIDDRVDVRLDDTITGLLESHAPLQNGGAHIFWREDGWLCLGVGFAPMNQGESSARRAAEANADAKMTETIFGVMVTVKETDVESLVDLSGFAELRQDVRKITRQEANGALRLVQTAGSWYTPEREEVAVVRVVGVPSVQLAGTAMVDDIKPIQVSGLEMEEDWRSVLRLYPNLLSGGATLVKKEGAVYLVAVGAAKNHSDPVRSRQTEIVAKSDAQRAIVKFANGVTTQVTDDAREETVIVEQRLNVEVLRDTEEVIRRIKQDTSGVVPGLMVIGRWRSSDDSRIFIAFAKKLND